MLNKLVLLNIFIHANIGLKNKYKWYKTTKRSPKNSLKYDLFEMRRQSTHYVFH